MMAFLIQMVGFLELYVCIAVVMEHFCMYYTKPHVTKTIRDESEVAPKSLGLPSSLAGYSVRSHGLNVSVLAGAKNQNLIMSSELPKLFVATYERCFLCLPKCLDMARVSIEWTLFLQTSLQE